jgi:hypothetical protein
MENGVKECGDDANHLTPFTPSTSGLGMRTSNTQRCERFTRIVPQTMPDPTVENVLRLERHNWVTGTGYVEDLRGWTGGHDESIHWNRLE